jgi:hypothetical protein
MPHRSSDAFEDLSSVVSDVTTLTHSHLVQRVLGAADFPSRPSPLLPWSVFEPSSRSQSRFVCFVTARWRKECIDVNAQRFGDQHDRVQLRRPIAFLDAADVRLTYAGQLGEIALRQPRLRPFNLNSPPHIPGVLFGIIPPLPGTLVFWRL